MAEIATALAVALPEKEDILDGIDGIMHGPMLCRCMRLSGTVVVVVVAGATVGATAVAAAMARHVGNTVSVYASVW
jgi:hypothetical protein